MRKISALILLLTIFSISSFGQSTVQQRIELVENNLTENLQVTGPKPLNLQQRMSFHKVKGLSIAVIKDYKIDWVKAYGVSDEALKISVTEKTLFQAASISKSINAVGVMKIFKQNKLDLFADINTYLSSWKFPYDSLSKGKKINTANLLSHTAGLSVHGFAGYEAGLPLPTIIQILNGENPANSDAVRSLFEPGIRQQYSGGGTTITQVLITDISKQAYDQYMEKEVLEPLGMSSSTFAQPPKLIKSRLLSTGYNSDGIEIKGKYHIYPEQAPAGLWTNPTDLAKYIIETQLAYAGKSAKVLDQTSTKLRLTPYQDQSAALGVFIEDYNGKKYFGHGGANEGFRSGYYGSFEGGNGLVIMVNSDNGEIIQELINSIATVYNFTGLNKSTILRPIAVEDKLLDSYLGNYQLRPELILTITRENKQVYAQATGQPRFEVFAETSTRFRFKDLPASMEFIKDEQGKVSKMIFIQGVTIDAKKL
jgi:CubicO group peptidase (beta-lactamase class C family)